MRVGYIPSVSNIPWSKAINEFDSTFKSVNDLNTIYEA
jgi:3-mercaptopyruvate sulfurtransferase SseA